MFTMNDLFEIAIKMEENGENTYLKSIDKTQNRELKSLLQWMADEEAEHARWFEKRKAGLILGSQEASLKEMVPRALQEMMGEKTLNLDEIDFSSFSTVSELIKTFVSFEEETILFYELLEMFVEDEQVREGLHSIIQEEKKHAEKLNSMIESVSEEYL